MASSLAEKTAVVTGGESGIDLAIAQAFNARVGGSTPVGDITVNRR